MVLPSKPTKQIRGSKLFLVIATLLLLLLVRVVLFRPSLQPNSLTNTNTSKTTTKATTKRIKATTTTAQGTSSSLPLWKKLFVDMNRATYATVIPTGRFQYQDTPSCRTSNKCRAYFPLVDLADLLVEEMGQQVPTDDQLMLPEKEPLVRTTLYPPPRLLTNVSDYSSTASAGDDSFALLTRCGHKGSVNQDRAMLLLNADGTKVVSLFDGHGDEGHVVAHAAMLALPSLLLPHKKPTMMTSQFLSDTILKLDRTIPSVPGSGATSIVMVQQESKLFLANLGDSFGFVAEYYDSSSSGGGGGGGITKIIHQTKPHKPHLLEERQRIERAGGRILLPPGPGETSRVIIPVGNMELALAMSRSLGDVEGKTIGVLTALPTIDVISLSNNNPKRQLFAVAATDGLMDYLDVQDVADHLGRVLFGTSSSKKKRLVDLCEQLIMQASKEWNVRLHGQYRDDISIIVTKL